MRWDGTERRRNKRYAVPDGVVRVARTGLGALFGPPSEKCVVLNLSDGGIAFFTREAIREGRAVAVLLEAPPLDRPVKVKGRVVWCEPAKSEQGFRVGVEWTNLTGSRRTSVRRVLDACLLEKVDGSTHVLIKKMEQL